MADDPFLDLQNSEEEEEAEEEMAEAEQQEFVIEFGINVDELPDPPEAPGWTVQEQIDLRRAVRHGKEAAVIEILDSKAHLAIPKTILPGPDNLFHLAVAGFSAPILSLLMRHDYDASLNAFDYRDMTPLGLAIFANQPECFRVLVDDPKVSVKHVYMLYEGTYRDVIRMTLEQKRPQMLEYVLKRRPTLQVHRDYDNDPFSLLPLMDDHTDEEITQLATILIASQNANRKIDLSGSATARANDNEEDEDEEDAFDEFNVGAGARLTPVLMAIGRARLKYLSLLLSHPDLCPPSTISAPKALSQLVNLFEEGYVRDVSVRQASGPDELPISERRYEVFDLVVNIPGLKLKKFSEDPAEGDATTWLINALGVLDYKAVVLWLASPLHFFYNEDLTPQKLAFLRHATLAGMVDMVNGLQGGGDVADNTSLLPRALSRVVTLPPFLSTKELPVQTLIMQYMRDPQAVRMTCRVRKGKPPLAFAARLMIRRKQQQSGLLSAPKFINGRQRMIIVRQWRNIKGPETDALRAGVVTKWLEEHANTGDQGRRLTLIENPRSYEKACYPLIHYMVGTHPKHLGTLLKIAPHLNPNIRWEDRTPLGRVLTSDGTVSLNYLRAPWVDANGVVNAGFRVLALDRLMKLSKDRPLLDALLARPDLKLNEGDPAIIFDLIANVVDHKREKNIDFGQILDQHPELDGRSDLGVRHSNVFTELVHNRLWSWARVALRRWDAEVIKHLRTMPNYDNYDVLELSLGGVFKEEQMVEIFDFVMDLLSSNKFEVRFVPDKGSVLADLIDADPPELGMAVLKTWIISGQYMYFDEDTPQEDREREIEMDMDAIDERREDDPDWPNYSFWNQVNQPLRPMPDGTPRDDDDDRYLQTRRLLYEFARDPQACREKYRELLEYTPTAEGFTWKRQQE